MVLGADSTYRITRHPNEWLPDTETFIELLRELRHGPSSQLKSFFSAGEVIVTRAPGRLDLMGGFADYSGSMVLEMPIAAATHVALQLTETPDLRVISFSEQPREEFRIFEIPLAGFGTRRTPITYSAAHDIFTRDPNQRWAAYVAGSFIVLMREKGTSFDRGARILIHSTVPEGKGVSSSAALEVATMQAVCAAYGINVSPRELAFLCQKVENVIAGAPCGIMDQTTAACGESGKLLALLCQPAEVIAMLKLPGELEVWGLDSAIKHSVAGADYMTVRTAASIGYRIIAELAGFTCHDTNTEGLVHIDDHLWNGYLANITVAEFATKFAPYLPERLDGGEFLARYKGTTDPVTKVLATQVYPVLAATRHPIYENDRVNRFVNLLQNSTPDSRAEELGELMYDAHQSYSDCGVGSEQTDQLVDLVELGGPTKGLYGAKITGGGSGGTVAVLGDKGAFAAVEEIAELYQKRTGHTPSIISGSSPGSSAFGHIRLEIH
ncbi:MAG TPA: galactokinase family protein [Pyrinomonadaceae bacterium]